MPKEIERIVYVHPSWANHPEGPIESKVVSEQWGTKPTDYLKATLIIEAPCEPITLTEEMLEEAIGPIGQGEWGKQELAKKIKKALFPDK